MGFATPFLMFSIYLFLPPAIAFFVSLQLFPKSRGRRAIVVIVLLIAALVMIPWLTALWPIALLVWPAVIVLAELFVTRH
jgi:hypothetical protein